MFGFIFKLILAAACIVAARYIKTNVIPRRQNDRRRASEGEDPVYLFKVAVKAAYVLAACLVIFAIARTSVIWVSSGHFATLNRIYFGKALPPGRVVALEGELGPRADVYTAGFHISPLITIFNTVEEVPVFIVPDGKCALLSAKDGKPVTGGQAFAAPWPDAIKTRMANDASYFLTEGNGQRGPQTTVLTPGAWMINPHLWEQPRLIAATRIEQGTVGVVKSSVLAAVDFGPFKRPLPTNNVLTVLPSFRLPKGAASALLVPVGAVGVWEEALPNGLFYINTDAYKMTMVPVIAQVYEYKGGYKRRTVDISVNDKGEITERVSETEVQEMKEAADKAIFTKPEGWDVAQEMRVLAQVSPELAPFVVASLGLTEANASKIIEERVVTPIIRSVTRDIEGGEQIPFTQQRAVTDANGKIALDEKGVPKTELHHEFRAVKVMDLLENRNPIEEAIKTQASLEAMKEGITILEVRLAESNIPAELLIARKRQQLAEQLLKAWAQEEIAQKQRQKTENARAQAAQQNDLVKADIDQQAALKRKEARATEGEGEKIYMVSVAEGQKAQKDVLGAEQTVRLQMFEQILKSLESVSEKNPQLLAAAIQNASKFVPSVVVNGQGGGSIEGAAAIFGHMLGGGNATALVQPPAVKETVVSNR